MTRAAVAAALLIGACRPDAAAPAPPDGAALYAGSGLCYACHGPSARGTPRGPDLTDGDWLHFATRPDADALAGVIARGVDEPIAYPVVMPPATDQLSAPEISAVAAYVLSLSSGSGAKARANPSAQR